MNVILLHDRIDDSARPDERDVLAQAEAVEAALAKLGHRSSRLAFSLNLDEVANELRRRRPDAVFNLVEAVEGHARLIHLAPVLLDTLKIPYTGAGPDAMYLTSNKLMSRRMLHRCPHCYVSGDELGMGFFVPRRYIIKPVWEDASVGIDDDSVVKVETPEQLDREIAARAAALGGPLFAEEFIEGREFNVALLAGPDGPQVLPPAEIRFEGYPPDKPRIVGYAAKWDTKSFEYAHTSRCFDFPPSDVGMIEKVVESAQRAWRALGLRGYARVDFKVDSSGSPWVLEVNANPCLSPDAGFAAALSRAGISFAEAISRILADRHAP